MYFAEYSLIANNVDIPNTEIYVVPTVETGEYSWAGRTCSKSFAVCDIKCQLLKGKTELKVFDSLAGKLFTRLFLFYKFPV